MEFNAKIWVLTDSRIGSNNQAIALAEKLDFDYAIIEVKFNALAKVPNFLMPKNFAQVVHPNFNEMLKEHAPDVVISASRRTALVSASIKKRFKSIKTIQILKPNLPHSNFDLILLPQHDRGVQSQFGKVIKFIGALNEIEPKINDGYNDFEAKYYDLINYEYASVIIGGNTKKYKFSKKAADNLADKLKKISETNKLKLFITYSRRTPEVLKDSINKILNKGNYIYDPEYGDFNPYPAMLKKCKFVISTIDSISMISEIVSTGKPLYLYIPDGFNSHKHVTFAYQLMDLKIAKLLDNNNGILQEYNYTRLSETVKIAEYVNSYILGVK
jgi:uncharacterized protein